MKKYLLIIILLQSFLVTSMANEKSLYTKLRVIKVIPSVTKQDEITQVLTYTASVEKYVDGVWIATTELSDTQKAQIHWEFNKNNNRDDKYSSTEDILKYNGLEINIKLNNNNIFKYGHVHAFIEEFFMLDMHLLS